jgi:ketosteroid isomerase-like protein
MKLNRRDMAFSSALTAGVAFLGIAASATKAAACETDELLGAIEDYRKAMVDGNGARLLELSADDMTFGHANGVVQTKVEFVKTVVDKVEIFKSIKLYDHKIKVDGDMGYARHTFEADLVYEGKPVQLTLGILQVWHREDGRWRLFARQSFKPITV